MYCIRKHINGSTPSEGALLLDSANNYIEIQGEHTLSGRIVGADLRFSVLSIKIESAFSQHQRRYFVASSMQEKDWKRLCAVTLNQNKKER